MEKELFEYDPETGKVKVSKFAREFYKKEGLDVNQVAQDWVQRLLKALDKKK